jgi:hypothetical protein
MGKSARSWGTNLAQQNDACCLTLLSADCANLKKKCEFGILPRRAFWQFILIPYYFFGRK